MYGAPDGTGTEEMTGIWEAIPNSCDTPTNRGASASDRSTWAAAVDTSGLSCDGGRDATTEEVLHLMTAAAAKVYPQLWGDSYSSAAGAAVQAANGDCGWGYSGDWKDPSGNGCTGQYASMSKARLLSRRPAGAPEASLIARPRLRLPRASASLGLSSSWPRWTAMSALFFTQVCIQRRHVRRSVHCGGGNLLGERLVHGRALHAAARGEHPERVAAGHARRVDGGGAAR